MAIPQYDQIVTLKKGDKSKAVTLLQEHLLKHEFLTDVPDGIFGGKTEIAVKKFQKENNLIVDGIAGKVTQYLLYYLNEKVAEDWKNRALSIICYFETSNIDPFTSLTGNFDGQIFSCGVLQLNIGQGSFQGLVNAVGKQLVYEKMANYGSTLWDACQLPATSIETTKQMLQHKFLHGKDLKPDAAAELRNLLSTKESKAYQLKIVGNYSIISQGRAKQWAAESRGTEKFTKEEFCWFFDLSTLNGNLEGIKFSDVKDFLSRFDSSHKAINYIYDWMRDYPLKVTENGKVIETLWKKDVEKNITIWKDIAFDEARVKLFVLGYLRAQKSRPQFNLVTMFRKGTICLGEGHVNGKKIVTELLPLIS